MTAKNEEHIEYPALLADAFTVSLLGSIQRVIDFYSLLFSYVSSPSWIKSEKEKASHRKVLCYVCCEM